MKIGNSFTLFYCAGHEPDTRRDVALPPVRR